MATFVAGGIAVVIATAVTIGLVRGADATAPAASTPAATTIAVHDFTKQLDKELTLDFQDTDLVDVMSFTRAISGLNIVIDPEVIAAGTAPVNLKVEKMALRHILSYIGKLTDTAIVFDHGALYCKPKSGDDADFSDAVIATIAPVPSPLDAALDKKISFNFQDSAMEDVIGFVRKISGLNVILMPIANGQVNPITLTLSDVPLRDALYWIGKFSHIAFVNDGKAIVATHADVGGFN